MENNQNKLGKVVKSYGKIWKFTRKSKIEKETWNKILDARTAYQVLILGQTAYQKCLLISTSDQNFVKLKTQATYDVRTSNVTNYEGLETQDHTEFKILAISKAISSNKLYR